MKNIQVRIMTDKFDKEIIDDVVKKSKGTKFESTASSIYRDGALKEAKRLLKEIEKGK